MLEGYGDFYRVSDFKTAVLLIQTSLEAVFMKRSSTRISWACSHGTKRLMELKYI